MGVNRIVPAASFLPAGIVSVAEVDAEARIEPRLIGAEPHLHIPIISCYFIYHRQFHLGEV